jgi:glycosyltransferase involved in cell wall biosynthesis
MRKPEPLLSCVVPAYNEEGNIGNFVPALAAMLKTLSPNYEIIVIDDGSADNTVAEAVKLVPDYPLTVLKLSRNFGKEHALTAGIDHARGDAVVLIDADFQHPLDMVPTMVGKWREGYDMIYGIRDRTGEGPIKRFVTKMFYKVLDAGTQIHMPSDAGDFRLLDRKVVDALKSLPERSRYMKGLFAWVGFRSVGIPFSVQERVAGESSFNLRRLSALAITGITAFSDLPLRIWSVVGAFIAAIALIYGGYVVIDAFVGHQQVPGWPTLTAGIMLFGGIQLISIGVLGEYIARIFNEVKGRPNYLIAERYEHAPEKAAIAVHAPGAAAAEIK